ALPSRPAPQPLSLHDALPISVAARAAGDVGAPGKLGDLELLVLDVEARRGEQPRARIVLDGDAVDAARLDLDLADHARQPDVDRSEEHTSELQSRENLVCRLL